MEKVEELLCRLSVEDLGLSVCADMMDGEEMLVAIEGLIVADLLREATKNRWIVVVVKEESFRAGI